MRREARFSLVALALIAAAGLLVTVRAGVAEVPLQASFEAVPDSLPSWVQSSGSPGDSLPPDPRAPIRLLRGYERAGRPVWVSVEYFPSQEEGKRPAARQLVFPGHGWIDLTEQPVQLTVGDAAGRPIDATLVLVEGRGGRFAVVYWYQIGQRSVASDHWYRAELLYNGLVRGRTDGALVRLASPLGSDESAAAVPALHSDFLREFYPLLLRSLPR